MARVTSMEVKEIIDTDLEDLSMFITPANLYVTEKLSGKGLSDALLKEIETWIAAHFLTCKERQENRIRMGETEAQYNTIFGEGLKSSTYGQTALLLDTSGSLSASGKPSVLIDVAIDLPTDTDY